MGNADYTSENVPTQIWPDTLEDAPTQVRPNVDIEAIIIRADGTIENLGVVASSADGTASVGEEEAS